MKATCRFRRWARCTKATARASRTWWITASACPRRWTTGRSNSKSSRRAGHRASSYRRRPPTTSARTPIKLPSRLCGRPGWSTRRSSCGPRSPRWTISCPRCTSACRSANACWSPRSPSVWRKTSPTISMSTACACAISIPTSTPSSASRSSATCASAASTCWSASIYCARAWIFQTFGRAARKLNVTAILYADRVTGSMQRAIEETERRRNKQLAYYQAHGITPRGIKKAITDIMEGAHPGAPDIARHYAKVAEETLEYAALTPDKLAQRIKKLEQQMYQHARDLEFEQAARVRDELQRLREHALKQTA